MKLRREAKGVWTPYTEKGMKRRGAVFKNLNTRRVFTEKRQGVEEGWGRSY